MRRLLTLGGALLTLTAGGCLGGGDGSELTVSAAASLSEAFEAYGAERAAGVRFSFGGSDELAAQIRQGGRPDVLASSDADYPEQLHAEGLVSEPVAFASNRLVIAVAGDSPIDELADLARPGTDLLIAAEGVPAGAYARAALGELPNRIREAVLANVRSEESDVKGIVGKLIQGAGDAGIVYASDVAAVGERLRAVAIPPPLQPEIVYAAAVVAGTQNEAEGREFIAGLVDGPGSRALREAGFLPAPGS